MTCECCDHPLQHAISAVLARFDAPIPPPKIGAVIDELRDALTQWEDAQ